MPKAARTGVWVVVAGLVLCLLWQQAFELTGVAPHDPGHMDRLPPAGAPELTPLPTGQVDLDRFVRETPIWSGLPY